jgi:AcrR family transcriptional regulator
MATSKTDVENTSLRDAHKRRTTLLLRESALELFLAKGYDSTTAEEVAERAGVSVRTFFRYFPTKDAVMFQGQRSWTESLTKIYCAQPDTMSELAAMCATLVKLGTNLNRQAVRRHERIVQTSPALRGRAQELHKENAKRVAEAIAVRRGLDEPDASCNLLGAVCGLMYRLALDDWLAGPRSTSLGEVIKEKFKLLAEPFLQAGRSPSRVVDRPVSHANAPL